MTFHGDSRAQKVADALDLKERALDFGVIPIAVVHQGVFQEVWKYGASTWKRVYGYLKREKTVYPYYLEKDKLFFPGENLSASK